ncbi:MAG: hypothetical protein RLZ63_731 [Pseudomonadota bacterium]|jgi:TRAP-type C4-dicarboxylate transport system permease small subunit
MNSVLRPIQRLVSTGLVVMLFAMVALTFIDVLGRRLFNTPVFGANDITEHLMAVIIFSGLPLLTAQRGHLSIDLFDKWLLTPGWRLWHKVVDVLIAAVLALIAYEYYLAIEEAKNINEVSQALLIPRYWMYGFISMTAGLAAITALFVEAPHMEHHEEMPS